ncbi:MAG: endonuclease MutS2, partial [Pseudobdellovibrionaceae bacterium]
MALQEALDSCDHPWAKAQKQALMRAEEPLSAIDQIMTSGGDIRSDASQTLYQLFNEKERLAKEVQNILDKLVKSHQLENMLQDRYVTTRQGRWVLPIRSGMQHFVQGTIQGSSQTKQTVFIEPEKTTALNNRLTQIEDEIEEEVQRLLMELSKYLTRQVPEFESSAHILEDCDVFFAKAQVAIHLEAQPIEFNDHELNLIDVVHPLLKLSNKSVTSNHLRLNKQKGILLLSGPNAGGKTVLLKSLGLAAQMARCGLLVCAQPGSCLPFFKQIFLSIGDAQSVDEELSTFAAHLKKLQQAIHLQGENTLILIDEICGSTDPEEGSALARSFIERLEKNKVFAMITSHLGPLKSGWDEDSAVISGSMEYDTKTGRPSYQFLPGIPGESLAIATAERVGVDLDVVHRAKELLSPTTRARLEGLSEIEKIKESLSQMQKQLRTDMHKTQNEKSKYEKLIHDFKLEKDQLLQKELKKAQKQVDEAIAHTKVENTFQKHRQLLDIKHQLPEIIKAQPQQSSGVPTSAAAFA